MIFTLLLRKPIWIDCAVLSINMILDDIIVYVLEKKKTYNWEMAKSISKNTLYIIFTLLKFSWTSYNKYPSVTERWYDSSLNQLHCVYCQSGCYWKDSEPDLISSSFQMYVSIFIWQSFTGARVHYFSQRIFVSLNFFNYSGFKSLFLTLNTV